MPYIILISPLLLAVLIVWLVATALGATYGSLGRAIAAHTAQPHQSSNAANALPTISVIVTTHNQAEALSRNLPSLLEQDYPDYEVIVVDIASSDETAHALETMEYEYQHLRHTSTPASARDISLERLAITLGIRSAHGTWIVLMTADSAPTSPFWLRGIAEETKDWRTLLIGTTSYDGKTSRTIQFEQLWETILTYSHIRRGKAALLPLPCNVALRRTAFAEAGGFGADLELRHGAVELLANRISKPRSTAYLLTPQTLVRHDAPTSKAVWQYNIIGRMSTLRHARHTCRLAIVETILLIQPWLLIIALGVPFAMSIITIAYTQAGEPIPNYILDLGRQAGAAAATDSSTFVAATVVASILTLMLLVYVAIKLHAVAKTARAVCVKSMPINFLYLELKRPLTLMRRHIRWLCTPRNEFRKRFV